MCRCLSEQARAAYANTVDCTTHPPCADHRMEHMDRFNATLLLINLDARLAAGETKTHCPTCGYWLWPNEIGTPPEDTTP